MGDDIVARATQTIRQHDPSATVQWADGALKVDSVLPAGTLVALLRAQRIDAVDSARSECCGNCCQSQ